MTKKAIVKDMFKKIEDELIFDQIKLPDNLKINNYIEYEVDKALKKNSNFSEKDPNYGNIIDKTIIIIKKFIEESDYSKEYSNISNKGGKKKQRTIRTKKQRKTRRKKRRPKKN